MGDPSSPTASIVLERFRRGEAAELEAIYRAYLRAVIRTVAKALRRYGGVARAYRRTVAAELPDLVQEVFARAFEPGTRQRFDGVREYGPYLGNIARNVVVDHLRRRRRWVVMDPALLASDPLTPVVICEPTEALDDLQVLAVVNRYLTDLPSDLQRVHDAIYVQGLSQREAAKSLGLGRQVVRTLQSKLQKGLRRAIERR